MGNMTRQEFMEFLFHDNYEHLKGRTLRLTRERIPGKEVCMAHIMTPNNTAIYHDLGLHIGTHEGEDHTGDTLGIIRFTPWESTVVGADCAMKAADVQIGFMDRFNGTLIIMGQYSEVETAVEEVVRFFRDELNFPACEIQKS